MAVTPDRLTPGIVRFRSESGKHGCHPGTQRDLARPRTYAPGDEQTDEHPAEPTH